MQPATPAPQSQDLIARFGLFLARGFLDEQTCTAIRAEARAAPAHPAPVYIQGAEGHVHQDVRKTSSVEVSAETIDYLARRLKEALPMVREHFKLPLTGCEPPQFLRYHPGDFFVRHQDGDTEQLEFDHLRARKVSIVLFLNASSAEPAAETYCGGELVFYQVNEDPAARPYVLPLAGEAGMLVAFRAETTHEVTPIEHGERYSIACWYR